MKVPTSHPHQQVLLSAFFTLAILVSVKWYLNMCLCMCLPGAKPGCGLWGTGCRRSRYLCPRRGRSSVGRWGETQVFLHTLIAMDQVTCRPDTMGDTRIGKICLPISTLMDSSNKEYKTFTDSPSVCMSMYISVQTSIHPTTKHLTSSPSKHPPIHLSTHSRSHPLNKSIIYSSFYPLTYPPIHPPTQSAVVQSCIHPSTKHLITSPSSDPAI